MRIMLMILGQQLIHKVHTHWGKRRETARVVRELMIPPTKRPGSVVVTRPY